MEDYDFDLSNLCECDDSMIGFVGCCWDFFVLISDSFYFALYVATSSIDQVHLAVLQKSNKMKSFNSTSPPSR
jgi:hypothetical protein